MRHVINSLFAFLMLSLLTPQIFSSAIEPEQVKETFIIPGNLSGSTSKNIVYTRDIYGGLEISDYHRTIFLNDIGEMSPNIREDEKTQFSLLTKIRSFNAFIREYDTSVEQKKTVDESAKKVCSGLYNLLNDKKTGDFRTCSFTVLFGAERNVTVGNFEPNSSHHGEK